MYKFTSNSLSNLYKTIKNQNIHRYKSTNNNGTISNDTIGII
jgi:hypothetical protein